MLVLKIKNQKGTSLIELIVAVAIFSLLILSAAAIFKTVIDGQRNAISAQNVQENMRYALEKISKEIRMAVKSETECLPAGGNKVFNTANGNTELYLKNQYDKCVEYYLEIDASGRGRLKLMIFVPITHTVIVDDFITPAKIEVSNLKFNVVDNSIGSNSLQPYVTMAMDIKAVGLALNEQKMKIQITISSRHYE